MSKTYESAAAGTIRDLMRRAREMYGRVLADENAVRLLPEDIEVLREHEDTVLLTYDAFLAEQAELRADSRFHSGLLPCPWIGNPESARVIVLMLNPGLHPMDYHAELSPTMDEHYVSALRNNLLGAGNEYPFFYLDPALCWHPGAIYWHARFDWMIRELSKSAGSIAAATSLLANETCCIQAVPYHSSSFSQLRFPLTELPSTKLAINLVEALSADPDRLIVVMRQADLWNSRNLCDWKEAPMAYRRGASIPKGSVHGNAILDRLTKLVLPIPEPTA